MNRREFLKGAIAVTALGSVSTLLARTGFGSDVESGSGGTDAENGMIYRTLGRTGLKVSAIAMGVEGFQRRPRSEVRKLFQYAADRGVNFLDICVVDPEIVSGFGDVMKGKRGQFVIQGHIGSVWENGQYRRTRNFSAAKQAFESLLKNLKTDYIDIGMIHYVDDEGDYNRIFTGETIRYAKELKANKVIRHIGLSTHSPEIARKAIAGGLVDVLMFSINLSYDVDLSGKSLTFNKERQSLYELCEREGVGVDVMKAYAGGNLLTDNSPFGTAFTPVQCLHYALTRPGVASVMAGCRTPAEIDAAVAWCSASSAARDYSQVLAKASKSTWTGYCLYCGHCAPCPKEIDIASVNKYLNLALAQKEVPDTVLDHYKLLKHHAGECIQCGACEKRCPFGVPVREKMKQTAKLFGV